MTIQIAVKLNEEKTDQHKNIYIFTDNQSIIQTIDAPK